VTQVPQAFFLPLPQLHGGFECLKLGRVIEGAPLARRTRIHERNPQDARRRDGRVAYTLGCMERLIVSVCLLASALAAVPSAGQVHPQDGIDRNLQERAAREREFHIRLQEDTPVPPRPVVSGETGLKFYLPTPGSEILRREKAAPAPAQPRLAPGKSVVDGETQLRESQRRRQIELQTQTQNLPEPVRQQTLQSQQLGFDRETSAQDLGSRILRDSSRALGAPR